MAVRTSSRASVFAWTPAMLGSHTVVRWRLYNLLVWKVSTNLRLALNAPFTPSEINTVYKQTWIACHEHLRRIVALRGDILAGTCL